jgi:hypothetical protein
MSLKDDLLRKGYLPENLPPAFSSEGIANFFDANSGHTYLSDAKRPVRPAAYNASKRGMARRTFATVHPVTGHDLAEFVSTRWEEAVEFFAQSHFSLSAPRQSEDGNRALQIASHSELDTAKLSHLSRYRFIAATDISRFYHSIYTHSIPWAFHGKAAGKNDRNARSAKVFLNRADHILRCGQDGQTIGIPVGPDASRVFAEIVGTAIDLEFKDRCDIKDYNVIRHVDDVWIGTNSYADAERALWQYREAIRKFELDINENKTRIYSEDFNFSDIWPTEVALKFQFAIESPDRYVPERLRAAFEYAFSFATAASDDGVLKYAIRYLDRLKLQRDHWQTVEPFLKRAAVHYGHTIDYVSRVIVWRHLVHEDVDIGAWSAILGTILDKHGRLGNDSEVCWGIYVCMQLKIQIPRDVADNIVKNCRALSVLALLNCVELDLADAVVFKRAREVLSLESATGSYWPILMEWISRRWSGYRQFTIEQDQIQQMAMQNVVIFNPERRLLVFKDIDKANFSSVSEAIERRVSQYDDDDNDDNDDNDLIL